MVLVLARMSQDKDPTERDAVRDDGAGAARAARDQLVAKGRSILERVRRAAVRVRTRLARDREAK
jgi:hypothetical protein